MYICSQKLLSVSFSEYSIIEKEFQWKQIRSQEIMSDLEYSVITSDVIKSFDCISSRG